MEVRQLNTLIRAAQFQSFSKVFPRRQSLWAILSPL